MRLRGMKCVSVIAPCRKPIPGPIDATPFSSSCPLSKEPGKVYLDAPQNASLTNGVTSGSLVSQVQAVKGGRGYNHQMSTEPPTEATAWQNNLSTTSKFVFTDLLPGKQYWVRVAVSGSRNQLVYSSVVNLFAQ